MNGFRQAWHIQAKEALPVNGDIELPPRLQAAVAPGFVVQPDMFAFNRPTRMGLRRVAGAAADGGGRRVRSRLEQTADSSQPVNPAPGAHGDHVGDPGGSQQHAEPLCIKL